MCAKSSAFGRSTYLVRRLAPSAMIDGHAPWADRPERPRPRSKRRILLSSKPIPKVRVPFNDKNELTSRIDGCATSSCPGSRDSDVFARHVPDARCRPARPGTCLVANSKSSARGPRRPLRDRDCGGHAGVSVGLWACVCARVKGYILFNIRKRNPRGLGGRSRLLARSIARVKG